MRGRRLRRRSKAERLAARGDVRRLIRLIGKHDWLVDADGHARDLAVGRRIEAVAALGSIESGDAEAGILIALADDDPRVKLAAVEALGSKPSARAARALARAAAAWRDPSLARARGAALELLISMADEVLAVVFAEALVDDPQRATLTGDEEAQLRRVFDLEHGRATMVLAERLVQRLASPDVRERGCVHQVIVVLGAAAVEPLVAALDDPARRAPACAGLAAIREPGPFPRCCPSLTLRPPRIAQWLREPSGPYGNRWRSTTSCALARTPTLTSGTPPSTRWALVPSSRSSAQVRFPTQRTGVSNTPTAHSGPEETTGFILPSSEASAPSDNDCAAVNRPGPDDGTTAPGI